MWSREASVMRLRGRGIPQEPARLISTWQTTDIPLSKAHQPAAKSAVLFEAMEAQHWQDTLRASSKLVAASVGRDYAGGLGIESKSKLIPRCQSIFLSLSLSPSCSFSISHAQMHTVSRREQRSGNEKERHRPHSYHQHHLSRRMSPLLQCSSE
jgi:hypothetical protein